MQDVRTLVTRYLGLSHLFTITKARWVHCVDAYNVVGNDVQNYRSVLKKPYNPRGVSNTKLHQLNKTNFLGTVVDFLKVAGLDKYEPQLVVAVAWMLQSGRYIIGPIFVQERKGDALISEPKVEALRKITADPLAAINIRLVRLVFYGDDTMERQVGFKYRNPWLPRSEVINELTYTEVMQYKKSASLPLRVQHLRLGEVTEAAQRGTSIVIDLHSSFACEPNTGCSAVIDALVLASYKVYACIHTYIRICIYMYVCIIYIYISYVCIYVCI